MAHPLLLAALVGGGAYLLFFKKSSSASTRTPTGGISSPGSPYGTVGYTVETDLNPMEIQQALNAMGYGPLTEDGIFGPATTQAVKDFQSAVGLVADGVVGPQTSAAIKTAMANQGLVMSTDQATQGTTYVVDPHHTYRRQVTQGMSYVLDPHHTYRR